jgi:hypothetical protein
VHRLPDEIQLIYIAAVWIRDLCLQRVHPTHVTPLFDAAYLLKARDKLNWEQLLAYIDNEVAAASLYLLLGYLKRQVGVTSIPPSILDRLLDMQRIAGPPEARISDAMTSRYLVGGRAFSRLFDSARVWEALMQPLPTTRKLALLPWQIAFPPAEPRRHELLYQLQRVRRLIQRF